MYSSWTSDTGMRGQLERAPLGGGGVREHRAAHAQRGADRVVGVDLDVDPQALERGEADAQRVAAALADDPRVGPQLGHEIEAAVGGRELEAHHVGHQQGDEPVAPAGGVARGRAAVGARQAELLEGEVAGVVVAPVELVERGVEESGRADRWAGHPRGTSLAHGVEVAQQLGVRRSACRPRGSPRRRRRRGSRGGWRRRRARRRGRSVRCRECGHGQYLGRRQGVWQGSPRSAARTRRPRSCLHHPSAWCVVALCAAAP